MAYDVFGDRERAVFLLTPYLLHIIAAVHLAGFDSAQGIDTRAPRGGSLAHARWKRRRSCGKARR
ncbi:MAG TPA: hypothetical protein VFL98_00185 [Candidatus Paceibacterota bacterium]|nr:hypothetical protein [Candidatus Paceibacterota bacterium]